MVHENRFNEEFTAAELSLHHLLRASRYKGPESCV